MVTGATVSIIVPVYNQLPRVLKFCQSVLSHRQKYVNGILLMDDASPDFDLRQLIGPPFSVWRNPENVGFVANENRGASMTPGKYVGFFNSDIEVHDNWIDPAVELMEKNPQIGVVGLKLTFPPNEKGEVNIQSAGGLYDVTRMPYHRYLGWLENYPPANKTEKISWVTGAAFLTRRDVFEKVGGFDEGYGRGYFDDPAYCESVKKLGYEIWYCAEASATHYVGSSMGAAAKTPEQQREASRAFYANARKFERDWAKDIVPDVQVQMVQF